MGESSEACENRRERQNRTRFAALIATPAVGAFTMPAGGRLAFRSVAGSVADDAVATLTGCAFHQEADGSYTRTAGKRVPATRTIKSTDLDASGQLVIDWLERAVVVTADAAFHVYVDIGLGRWAKIAEGA